MSNEILDLISDYKKLSHDSRSNMYRISKFNSMGDDSSILKVLGEIDVILTKMSKINKTVAEKLDNPALYKLYFQLQYNIDGEKFEECEDITSKINDIEQNKLTN